MMSDKKLRNEPKSDPALDAKFKAKLAEFVERDAQARRESGLLPIHADRSTLREPWAWFLMQAPPAGSA
jgi:hypothetical protein